MAIDQQHNLQLQVTHVKRDGLDAGPTAAANMQSAMNRLFGKCGNACFAQISSKVQSSCPPILPRLSPVVEERLMLVLLVQAPPIEGIAAQPKACAFLLQGSG